MRTVPGAGLVVLALAVPGALLVAATSARQDPAAPAGTRRPPILRARFAPVANPSRVSLSSLVPVPPTFPGKERHGEPQARMQIVPEPMATGSALPPEASPPSVTAGADLFLADGSETALGVDGSDANILAAALNQGYLNTPSLLTSSNGNGSWLQNVFPNGAGAITGQAFDPWSSPGNSPGELFASQIRRDSTAGSKVTHVVLARSGNGGGSWSHLFEVNKTLVQDRDMFDVDRTAARGGGTGAAHDGKLYLAYDGFTATAQENYVASYLRVVSPSGASLGEVTTSLPTQGGFNGSHMQPVAGTLDGQVYLMSVASDQTGAVKFLLFHEVTGAGAGFTAVKSGFGFQAVGQQLGTTRRWGLNGHRIETGGQMDIDRSSGPRRGTLYVLSGRNPNPADSTQDQGDIWLTASTDGAATWNEAVIPGLAAGKTQFFAMLDVDDDGWIHVAYYQNETGLINNGVLNASTANLYYTVSSDGGLTWSPHTQVNGSLDSLVYFDPQLDLSSQNYYLIGDYAQVRAGRAGGVKVAYVLWSGYSKYRSDVYLYDKRDRVICTTMTPAIDSDGDGVLDPQDNCPTIYNPGQDDLNTNGIGDLCECLLTRVNVDNTGSSLNRIDGSDLFPLARSFGACSGDAAYNASTDFSPQGCVDGYDLAILAGVWAESVPVTCP